MKLKYELNILNVNLKTQWMPFTISHIQQEVKDFNIENTKEVFDYKWGKDKRMIECFYKSKDEAINVKLKYT